MITSRRQPIANHHTFITFLILRYLDTVVVEHRTSQSKSVFPVIRWIHANDKLVISEFDCSLPANDKNQEQRKDELEKKRKLYRLAELVEGAPKQAAMLPDDERFSNEYKVMLEIDQYIGLFLF